MSYSSEPGADDRQGKVSLTLQANGPSVEIEVFNQNLDRVAEGFGTLNAVLSPGIYQVNYRAGSALTQQLISLKPDTPQVAESMTVDFPTAAPISSVATPNREQAKAVGDLTRPSHSAVWGLGEIVVFVRQLSETAPPIDDAALATLSLHDSQMRKLGERPPGDLLREGIDQLSEFERDTLPDPIDYSINITRGAGWAATRAPVPPGGYTLRVTRPARTIPARVGKAVSEESERIKQESATDAQQVIEPPLTYDLSVWVERGWQTIIFVPMRRYGPSPEYASVHMVRTAEDWDPDDPETQASALALESVLEAMRSGRRAVSREHQALLLSERFVNPMLGIVGAHSILLGRSIDWELYDDVVRHLRSHLPRHPDVIALVAIGEERRREVAHIELQASVRTSGPSDSAIVNKEPEPPPNLETNLEWPPMLLASYQGLIRCDSLWPSLGLIVEGSFAEKAAARLVFTGTWTTWEPIPVEDVPSAVAEALLEASNIDTVRRFTGKWVSRTLKFFGANVAQRDWQRVIDLIPPDEDPATVRLREYLGELVANSSAATVKEFLDKVNVQQLSRAIDLPTRVVQSRLDAVSSEIASSDYL